MWTVDFEPDPEWWILGIIALMAAVYALCNPKVAPTVISILLIIDAFALYDGVSLWWVFGAPAGFITLVSLFVCLPLCCANTGNRHHHGGVYAHSAPSSRDQTINERTRLLASNESRLLVGNPQGIGPQPSTSYRVVVEPRLQQFTTPTYPSPAVVDASRSLYANPTARSLTTVAERQLVRVAKNSAQPARKISAHIPRPEIDGILLHASVTAEVDDIYPYDQQIKTDSAPHSAIRSVVGVFRCYSCKRKKDRLEPRIWSSKGICVEIWMSSTGHRYRTRLHSQKCKHCDIFVEPEADKDNYVTKVVKVLDGWTGQRSEVKPLQNFPSTGPHQTNKCHACLKGICHQKPTK